MVVDMDSAMEDMDMVADMEMATVHVCCKLVYHYPPSNAYPKE